MAKNFLRVPTPFYVQRTNEISMTRRNRSLKDEIIFWTNPLLGGVEGLSEFISRFEFFSDKPELRLQVLNLFVTIQFNHMVEALKALSPEEVYEIFLREFKAAGSSQPALISYLPVMNNFYRNELMH